MGISGGKKQEQQRVKVLSGGMLDKFLHSATTAVPLFFLSLFFGCSAASGISDPHPGMKPVPPALEVWSLTAGPPGKLHCFSYSYCFSHNLFNTRDVSWAPASSSSHDPVHHKWKSQHWPCYPRWGTSSPSPAFNLSQHQGIFQWVSSSYQVAKLLGQTHVHWVSDAIQPSHPLSSPSPPAPNLAQHQGLFKWVSSLHQVAKDWSFSFSISPLNEYSGLISCRIDWFDLGVEGILKSLLQHHSSKASILWRSAFFIVQLSHPYMTTREMIALTRLAFVGRVMSLLFNMLSRSVIAFLPTSKHLLISCILCILDLLSLFGRVYILLYSFSREFLRGKWGRHITYNIGEYFSILPRIWCMATAIIDT